jgi:DNA polymerase I
VGLSITKTSMDHLRLLDHDLARALLAYWEAKSGLATFGEKFFEPTEDGREVYLDGRLYPTWGMCAADTGRMSCASPNVQNIPNKSRLGGLRGCVVAPKAKHLIKADYSQIELRIVAKVRGGTRFAPRTVVGPLPHARVHRRFFSRSRHQRDLPKMRFSASLSTLSGSCVGR